MKTFDLDYASYKADAFHRLLLCMVPLVIFFAVQFLGEVIVGDNPSGFPTNLPAPDQQLNYMIATGWMLVFLLSAFAALVGCLFAVPLAVVTILNLLRGNFVGELTLTKEELKIKHTFSFFSQVIPFNGRNSLADPTAIKLINIERRVKPVPSLEVTVSSEHRSLFTVLNLMSPKSSFRFYLPLADEPSLIAWLQKEQPDVMLTHVSKRERSRGWKSNSF